MSRVAGKMAAIFCLLFVFLVLVAAENDTIVYDVTTLLSNMNDTEEWEQEPTSPLSTTSSTTTTMTSTTTSTTRSTTKSTTTLTTTTVVTTRMPRPTFVLPPRPHNSRYGPYFEDGPDAVNITATVGSTIRMDCKLGMLHDKTVSWLRRKTDSIQLLTVGRLAYSSDQRITLSFRYPSNWRLEILFVNRRDDGLYECQVATHPPLVKQVFLKVSAPEVKITDEARHEVTERYYKAGSVVQLTCKAVQVEAVGEDETMIWWRESEPLTKGVTINRTVAGSIASTLTIKHAQKRDSGNYTCSLGRQAFTSVLVHVLNGELPAAVHDGSSGTMTSRLFATWHLSLSCLVVAHNTIIGR
ncbi:uncharacterized protein LOC111055703 [Nilaparvata lugens]|uniref:uncharacterized protein LOC111055703 n=1 Tax=Nilaparvata lugens TaxID=108931 RepID=UPI00193DC909|nr:uncharacterized protein LOC111055703 [Nilaparvata lugens]